MSKSQARSTVSKERILKAAGAAFRSGGYGGTGIDGVAKGAELTSGALYFHFPSKLDVFVAAVRHGISDLRDGIRRMQEERPATWMRGFVEYYLSFKRTCSLEEGCSFPILAPEVERAGEEAKEAFEQELEALIATLSLKTSGKAKLSRAQSILLLATLSGGVNMARAVRDPALSEEIARAIKRAVLANF